MRFVGRRRTWIGALFENHSNSVAQTSSTNGCGAGSTGRIAKESPTPASTWARERDTGDYTAIQCKFYEPTHMAKADIDSFSPPRARSRSPTG